MVENYESLLERISAYAGIDKKELERKIEARRAKLSGLISKEGAAQIVAAELGVRFDNVQLKISELMAGMKKVNFTAKVLNIFPVRSFDKNGKKGKVANFIVADESGNTRVVLWDTNHIDLIENGEIKQNDVVEISNASVREGEVHLSGFSEFKKSAQKIDKVKIERDFAEKSIDTIQPGNAARIRGVIVQMFTPRFFFVCPACGKKAISDIDGFSCAEHGKVAPKEKALLNLVVDDGTDSIRATLFSDELEKLISFEKLKDAMAFVDFKTDLLGTEVYIKGVAKKNALFNNIELTVQEFSKVDAELLIQQLEK